MPEPLGHLFQALFGGLFAFCERCGVGHSPTMTTRLLAELSLWSLETGCEQCTLGLSLRGVLFRVFKCLNIVPIGVKHRQNGPFFDFGGSFPNL